MTAWTESEKSNIRAYLGFPALFHQQEPRLENAINSVQSVADGGVLPTSDTQERMRTVLSQLSNVDTKITALYCQFQVLEVSNPKTRLDAIRAAFYLKMEGRRLITQLAIPLGTKPFRDYYSPLPLNNEFGGNSPFPTDLG